MIFNTSLDRFECGPVVLRACEVLKHILELQGPLPFMVEVGVDRGEDPRPETSGDQWRPSHSRLVVSFCLGKNPFKLHISWPWEVSKWKLKVLVGAATETELIFMTNDQ